MQTILDALRLGLDDERVQRLIDAFDGEPVEVHELHIGEPAVLSRHLLFDSGGELVLHDAAVIAVIPPLVDRLHIEARLTAWSSAKCSHLWSRMGTVRRTYPPHPNP